MSSMVVNGVGKGAKASSTVVKGALSFRQRSSEACIYFVTGYGRRTTLSSIVAVDALSFHQRLRWAR